MGNFFARFLLSGAAIFFYIVFIAAIVVNEFWGKYISNKLYIALPVLAMVVGLWVYAAFKRHQAEAGLGQYPPRSGI